MMLGELWRGKDAMGNDWVVSRYNAILPNLVRWQKVSRLGAKLLDQVSSWDGRKWSSIHWRPYSPIVPEVVLKAVENAINDSKVDGSGNRNVDGADWRPPAVVSAIRLQPVGSRSQPAKAQPGSDEGQGE